jgi:hypothetical protein
MLLSSIFTTLPFFQLQPLIHYNQGLVAIGPFKPIRNGHPQVTCACMHGFSPTACCRLLASFGQMRCFVRVDHATSFYLLLPPTRMKNAGSTY